MILLVEPDERAADLVRAAATEFLRDKALPTQLRSTLLTNLSPLCARQPLEGAFLDLFRAIEHWEASLPADRAAAEAEVRAAAVALTIDGGRSDPHDAPDRHPTGDDVERARAYFRERSFDLLIEERQLHAEHMAAGDPGRASFFVADRAYYCVDLVRDGAVVARQYAHAESADEALLRARQRFASEQG